MNKNSIKIKSLVLLVLASFIILSLNIYAELPGDVVNHWAKNQISDWISKGYIKGYEDGSFKPDSNIKRAEFFAIINRANNFTKTAEVKFTDVPSDAWFAQDIAKAVAAGYVSGYTDNTIRPENNITRQEVAVIIVKLKGLQVNEAAASVFDAKEQIPQWSKGYIGALVSSGIMKGYPDGTFGADKSITRAEAVVASNNAINAASPAATPAPTSAAVVIPPSSSHDSGDSGGGNTTSKKKVELSAVGGSMIMGSADEDNPKDITLMIDELTKLSSELNVSADDLRSGKVSIGVTYNGKEYTFEYYAEHDSLQAIFKSTDNKTDEATLNALMVYIK